MRLQIEGAGDVYDLERWGHIGSSDHSQPNLARILRMQNHTRSPLMISWRLQNYTLCPSCASELSIPVSKQHLHLSIYPALCSVLLPTRVPWCSSGIHEGGQDPLFRQRTLSQAGELIGSGISFSSVLPEVARVGIYLICTFGLRLGESVLISALSYLLSSLLVDRRLPEQSSGGAGRFSAQQS